MYSRHLAFGQDDYLELASRLTSNGEELALSLRGKKNTEEITLSSVLLTKEEARSLVSHIEGWLETLQ